MVVPLSTSTSKDVATHVYLAPGETGLEGAVLKAEDVSVVLKEILAEPRRRLRNISNARICELADKIRIAMSC